MNKTPGQLLELLSDLEIFGDVGPWMAHLMWSRVPLPRPLCPVECPVLQIGRDRQIGMGPSRGGIGGGILINTLETLRLKLSPLELCNPRTALSPAFCIQYFLPHQRCILPTHPMHSNDQRAILGTMTVEEIIRDRQTFSKWAFHNINLAKLHDCQMSILYWTHSV